MDNLELIEYMCNKLGISLELHGKDLDWTAVGMVKGHLVYVLNRWSKLLFNVIYGQQYSNCPAIFSNHKLEFNALNCRTTLEIFVSSIHSFKVDGLNLCISNPFYGFIDVLKCTSLEEAKIACDLHYPNDISREVFEKVAAKEKTLDKQKALWWNALNQV